MLCVEPGLAKVRKTYGLPDSRARTHENKSCLTRARSEKATLSRTDGHSPYHPKMSICALCKRSTYSHFLPARLIAYAHYTTKYTKSLDEICCRVFFHNMKIYQIQRKQIGMITKHIKANYPSRTAHPSRCADPDTPSQEAGVLLHGSGKLSFFPHIRRHHFP